jgi:hypothetical protein
MTPRQRRGELTASAARYTARRLRTKPVDGAWQERAWVFYDETPEVRFAARWYSNAMSRARLFAGRRDEEGNVVPLPANHRASELVAEIAGGPNGQAQLLKNFGPHLVVPGEGWIVVRPRRDSRGNDIGVDWRVLSTQEVKPQGNNLVAEIDGEEVVIPGAEDDKAPLDASEPVGIRVWESHPRRHLEADSSVRCSLILLEELKLLNAAVAAIARSRLTGRGIVLVPQGTKFPTAPGQENEEDDLIEVLMTVAETAYKEPDSAAATVPIILEVPADQIPNIKRLTFESDFDTLAIQLREEAITRFANGLEVPSEILLGRQGDVNHWGQWALKDEAITLGVEPKLATVTDALTVQYLQPILEFEDVEDALECLVWADTSPLRVRTNRAETALKVHEAGAISDAALRRETGFTDADAPTEEERTRRKQQPANDDPELPVDESNAEPEQPTSDPAEEGPDLDLAAAAVVEPVDVSALHAQTVLAAIDGVIHNAMCMVGEKIRVKPACPRSERGRSRQIAPGELHTVFPVSDEQVDQWHLLVGAWDRVPEMAQRYGFEAECLIDTLDHYARALIAARMKHSFEETVRLLRNSCLGLAA